MSFSKAKLQRFNDIKGKLASTPSKVKELLKSVSAQKDKFTVTSSPSITSIQSSPCFRTPNVPKKKKLVAPASKTKLFKTDSDGDALKEKIVECHNKDVYIKDLVEEIEDIKLQLSHMTKKKLEMEEERVKYEEELSMLEAKHDTHISNVKRQHQTVMLELNSKINTLTCTLDFTKDMFLSLKLKSQEDIEAMQKDISHVKILYEKSLATFNKELASKDKIVQDMEIELAQLLEEQKKLKENQSQEMDDLVDDCSQKVCDLDYEMEERMELLQEALDKDKEKYDQMLLDFEEKKSLELLQMREAFTAEKRLIESDCDAKIKQMEENCSEAKILSEMQMTEKCNDIEESCKLKLDQQEKQAEAILKECQAISEYNIIQCELEKNRIMQELSKKIQELKQLEMLKGQTCTLCYVLEQRYHGLELELNSTIVELSDEREQLKYELEMYKDRLKVTLGDKKVYEISISKTHKTIEALKNRLLDSDRDVEQLKGELERCEQLNLEFESKCNQLSDEVQLLLNLNEDLEIQQEKHVIETEEYISSVERQLTSKVDMYKKIADEAVTHMTEQLKEKQEELLEMQQSKIEAEASLRKLSSKLHAKEASFLDVVDQLHEQQKLTSDVQISIGKTVLEIDDLECNYTVKLTKLRDVITEKDNKIESLYDTVAQLEKRLHKYGGKQNDIENLLKQINQLQDRSTSYYQYCEYYKNKSREYEEEMDDLSKINKKYIDQSGKYDALLQKYENMEKENTALKRTVDEQKQLLHPFQNILQHSELTSFVSQDIQSDPGLKLTNIEGKLEKKLASQNKIIEKLRKEIAALSQSPKKLKHKAEKENMNSPTSRLLSSPHVGSPLRERNLN